MERSPYHQPKSSSAPYKGLQITTIVFGAFGFFLWTNGIGFSLGYCFYSLRTFTNYLPVFGAIIYIPVNIAYIFYVSRIIFCITAANFPDPAGARDVRKTVSRLVAVALVGMAEFVTATVWFSIEETFRFEDMVAYAALFGCSFSFIWAYLVSIFAGVYEAKCSKRLAFNGVEAPRIDGHNPRTSAADIYARPNKTGHLSRQNSPDNFYGTK